MNVLFSGRSWFIDAAVCKQLLERGHEMHVFIC